MSIDPDASAHGAQDGSAHDAEVARPRDSRRDPGQVRENLQRWLATKVTAPVVENVHLPETTGMSSETLLFDARWDGTDHPLVARVAPADTTVPVFPAYDLEGQARVMRAVGEHSTIPVPRVHWYEPDPAPLGAPFFVMTRVAGRVPPDVMPYNFGSWVTEAGDAERAAMQDACVDVLARIHDVAPVAAGLGPAGTVTDAVRAHLDRQRSYYEWTTRTGGPRSPLVERALAWLDARCPDDRSPAVLCWGDARIGNILFDGFRPVAVLDWELATLGAREMDLAWMTFLHRFFEDIAAAAGLPGLPGFLRLDDVARAYAQRTGHVPRDLHFYTVHAALQHAIIMLRIHTRAVHFGQAQPPGHPDDAIMHRAALEAMLDGTDRQGVAP
ncbi:MULTISPECIES: phosphotransferase family protein [Rhodococcus]|uniref:phosphotransferase family protein n=1 Tax=Rhodococcus TaxID=1827 RepID=UPI000C9BEAA4|nr:MULTISPECIES: phosphotransferase family protein [Rhodococcus]PND53207.1 phosphotransferase family protein [Rhodococcus sp. ENV425]USC14639.1 phosphotransferase family protein [Rhodococcus sp. 11-3]WKW97981.1 phosphotransferase family protein [Rhodococcus aetherivorans]